MKKTMAILALAVSAVLAGCGSVGTGVSLVRDKFAEAGKEQCAKPEWRRVIERAAVSAAVFDGEVIPKALCPGDAEYIREQENAKTAFRVFDALQEGNYRRALAEITEVAAALGVRADKFADSDGCIASPQGWRLCPPPE